MPHRARLFLSFATALCLVAAFASPAAATEATFKRGVSNLLLGPLDVALSPGREAGTVGRAHAGNPSPKG